MEKRRDRRQTTSQRALVSLRRMIVAGEFPAGQRLYEAELSERLDLSRTPLREALTRLAEEGLVERAGGMGFRVRGFTRKDVSDALELRGTLEGLAARLAVERGAVPCAMKDAREAVDALDAVVGAWPGAGVDLDAYADGNAKFHDALARICGGGIILAQIERVCRMPFASPSAFLHARARLDDFERSLIHAQGHHRSILHAIDVGEGARAEALAREHARLARDNLDKAIASADETGIDPAGLMRLID